MRSVALEVAPPPRTASNRGDVVKTYTPEQLCARNKEWNQQQDANAKNEASRLLADAVARGVVDSDEVSRWATIAENATSVGEHCVASGSGVWAFRVAEARPSWPVLKLRANEYVESLIDARIELVHYDYTAKCDGHTCPELE